MLFSSIAKIFNSKNQFSDFIVSGFSTNSKENNNNKIFIAIAGKKHDGHDYINEAIKNGAAGIIANNNYSLAIHVPLIKVLCTIKAIYKIAVYKKSFLNFPMIGITGSCGKTTTKELISNITKISLVSLVTQNSFNNNIGIPLTLLNAEVEYDIGVIEVGTSMPGEILYLSNLIKCNIAIITNIFPAHLSGLKSEEYIKKEKSSIFSSMKEGIAIINMDQKDHVSFLKEKAKHLKIRTFGLHPEADIRASFSDNIKGDIKIHANNDSFTINPIMQGKHNIMNILAAIAATIDHCSKQDIINGINKTPNFTGRLETITSKSGLTIINDSYNANPESLKAALKHLKTIDSQPMAILGEMLELGSQSKYWHEKIGEFANNIKIKYLVAIGPESKSYQKNFDGYFKHFNKKNDALLYIKTTILDNKISSLLIKGSRKNKLESMINDLKSI